MKENRKRRRKRARKRARKEKTKESKKESKKRRGAPFSWHTPRYEKIVKHHSDNG